MTFHYLGAEGLIVAVGDLVPIDSSSRDKPTADLNQKVLIQKPKMQIGKSNK